MSDSREHIDTLWQRALRESVEAGEEFTRYRFAAMIEAETARRCAEIVGDIDEDLPVDLIAELIKAEFPEAFK